MRKRKLDLLGHVSKASLSISTLFNSDNIADGYVEGLFARGSCGDGLNVRLPALYLVDDIPVSRELPAVRSGTNEWEHLKGISLAPLSEVDLLIGSDVPAATEPLEVVPAPNAGEPYAVRTRLGWTVYGYKFRGQAVSVHRVAVLDEQVRRAFDVGFEDLGHCGQGLSCEDKIWMKSVSEGTRRLNGRYEICMPTRDILGDIPYTKLLAKRRAEGLRKKLLKNEVLCRGYVEGLRDMLLKGYAEEIPSAELEGSSWVWYIPHFEVLHPMKPGKVRMVMDCASKVRGMSLNEILLPGPTLGNEMLAVMFRFRLGEWAYAGDIEAMFHQVCVPKDQRDLLRFLWWAELEDPTSLREYRMRVHPFGACSSPSVAAYALLRSASDCPHISAAIRLKFEDCFYVDDCLSAGDSESDMREEVKVFKRICKYGGFNLGKFRSNFSLEAGENKEVEDGITKVLGLTWNTHSDKLSCPGILAVPTQGIFTRRRLLSLVASVYNPLGIADPLVLKGRLILQETLRLKGNNSWDAPFNSQFNSETVRWIGELSKLANLVIPRHVGGLESSQRKVQLHLFADASQRGHGAVAYLRNCELEVHCSFVWGKARVNPIKAVSIPRLELAAALLAARMRVKIEEIWKVTFREVYLWTDSMVVLKYLRNLSARFPTFVANRVSLIKEMSKLSEWHYVRSECNPADDASRAIQSERWLHGPTFLKLPESQWEMKEPDERGIELEIVEPRFAFHMVGVREHPLDIMAAYCSTWTKLKRMVSVWLLLKRCLSKKGERGHCVTAETMLSAETELLSFAQRQVYNREMELLSRERPIGKGSSLMRFDVMLRDGLLCVGGRLGRTDLSYDCKHPIILPASNRVTVLIIEDTHVKLGHLGENVVLAKLRERFWPIKGHSTVKRVLHRCILCRKMKRPVSSQKMADLHEYRVSGGKPAFTFTGVDCFGPLFVKVGRRREKRHGVIFTCLTMRAVHLELVHDLSSDAMVNAVCRFMARRGTVQTFVSDNGTNFVGARKDLLSLLTGSEVQREVLKRNVSWEFNTPTSSHSGGAWESLIRIVRRVLDVVIHDQCLSEDALRTVLCEAESAINSRPLTFISGDHRDLEAITPNKLLLLRDSHVPKQLTSKEEALSRKRWRQVQYIADAFWRRWTREYLSALQDRRKWPGQNRNMIVDDVVLMVDNTQPRCHWNLGRVVRVFTGVDGLVRNVEVLSHGKNFKRPVNKLILLLEKGDVL